MITDTRDVAKSRLPPAVLQVLPGEKRMDGIEKFQVFANAAFRHFFMRLQAHTGKQNNFIGCRSG
ncbi:hypothetical protein [Candidatus Methylospira mobilis]|uniref:hypothetical protein n=1 Tax=Candidatus Methylospira mobilis TaxID=1808979 RepID=UPI001884980B|nr:hypothetical protein [Candidatus Methylospira mobilis]